MIGAPRPLPLAKPAAVDTAQAARYFGARGEPDEKTMALLETCALPLLAKKIGFDPAVMASPFITTIVDALSLLIYFRFASFLLGI